MSDLAAAPSAQSAASPPPGAPIGYADRPGLVGLLAKNFFLTLVSLGFYRFWARARLRRYFWSNILIANEPLEYTGTGLELFIGFLIAIAVIAPIGIGYVILQRVMLGNPAAAGGLSLVYFLVLLCFVQIVVFRARRYRLSRTAWRGIYAAQTGSAWRYLALSLLYTLATLLSFGLAMPWRSVALERYKINHSWFGESRFSLDAKAGDLFPYWLVVIGLLMLPLLAFAAINLAHLVAFFHDAAMAQLQHRAVPPPHFAGRGLLAIAAVAGIPAFIWYWVRQFRYLASSTRLGEVRLVSSARGSTVVTILLLFGLGMIAIGIGFTIVLVVGALVIGKTVGAALAAKTVGFKIAMAIAAILPLYLLVFAGAQILSYRWLRVPILRHIATTLKVENLAAIASVTQSSKRRQKFGIADSFDIGAI